jgi:prepilin-type N-terminal cleavage/methylation domain-containing protein
MSGDAKAATRPGIRAGPRGSSLVELLVVIAIVGLVTTGMYSFFLTTSQTYSDQAVNARMLQTATTAMSRITQDIRQAGMFWAPACIPTMPATTILPTTTMMMQATNGPPGPGSITIRVVLDDPIVRTEIATTPITGQPNTNTTIGVLSTTGFPVNSSTGFLVGDTAFITDGVQCTRFTVTGVVGGANPGLQHVPANDVNTFGGTYTYPVATSMVYQLIVNKQIRYSIDTMDPKTSWLTKDTGGGSRRLVPDVESQSFSYGVWNGTTVQMGVDPATITTAAQAANIRTVNVSLKVKADTQDRLIGGDGFRRQTLTSTVQLRNLGS